MRLTPKSTKLKYTLLSMLASAVLIASACGSVPIKTFYTLNNSIEADSKTADSPPVCPISLGINPVEVSPPYDISKIIFRPNPLEVRFYTQSRWVSPLEDMFAVLIARRIEALHLFSAVDRSINVSGPHLSLSVKVYAVEEVDKGRDRQARLAVSLLLRDEMEDTLLWEHSFDRREETPKNEVKSVVDMLNRIYNDEMEKAGDSLKAFLLSDRCRSSDSTKSRAPSSEPLDDDDELDTDRGGFETTAKTADREKAAQ